MASVNNNACVFSFVNRKRVDATSPMDLFLFCQVFEYLILLSIGHFLFECRIFFFYFYDLIHYHYYNYHWTLCLVVAIIPFICWTINNDEDDKV